MYNCNFVKLFHTFKDKEKQGMPAFGDGVIASKLAILYKVEVVYEDIYKQVYFSALSFIFLSKSQI